MTLDCGYLYISYYTSKEFIKSKKNITQRPWCLAWASPLADREQRGADPTIFISVAFGVYQTRRRCVQTTVMRLTNRTDDHAYA
jgi:hypothetical protein